MINDKITKKIINTIIMNHKFEEKDFFCSLTNEGNSLKVKNFKEVEKGLRERTAKLPVCFQHRIELMRLYVEDFDLLFWAPILSCCELAHMIESVVPHGNISKLSIKDVDELAKNFGVYSVDDKVFAISLAYAKSLDEKQGNSFEDSQVMYVLDPWPITPISSEKRQQKITFYHNSEKFAQIEHSK